MIYQETKDGWTWYLNWKEVAGKVYYKYYKRKTTDD